MKEQHVKEDEMEKLDIFKKGWESCAYDQGLANPKDDPEYYFNKAKIKAGYAAATPVKEDAEIIAEVMQESGGLWMPCSGCHETVDGQETGHYRYSEVFKSIVGSGCHECGGIGVVWNNYEDYPAPVKATEGTFEDYMMSAREKFLVDIHNQKWDNKMRTAAEDLLICFDQMRERLKESNEAIEALELLLKVINRSDTAMDYYGEAIRKAEKVIANYKLFSETGERK